MKAQELRIGNWVYDETRRLNVQIEDLSFDYVNGNFRPINIEKTSPIPLTEQWLIDFGFERRNDSNFWLNGFCLKTYDNEFYVLTEQKRVFIKFVHTLQNLYFALTGQELQL